MILIISNEFDQSTHEVLEWIVSSTQEKFIVLNEYNSIKQLNISLKNDKPEELIIHTTLGDTFRFADISYVWYRRGPLFIEHDKNRIRQEQIERSLKQDWTLVTDFIFKILAEKHFLGNPVKSDVNKFHVLLEATRCGLSIPSTLITNFKADIIEQFQHTKVVSKPFNGIQFNSAKSAIFDYTTELDLSHISDSFKVSFIQELIYKKYELRIFYIQGEFYSSAIFSQANQKTQIDFRKYDFVKPNRVVPFKLPSSIEDKLKTLMNRLELDTGSIDLIVTPNDEYIFLEVNPVGQFGMVSKPCNYYLEREISKILIQNLK